VVIPLIKSHFEMSARLFYECYDVSCSALCRGSPDSNYLSALYGSPSDFDEWAEMTGDESWSWNNFSKYALHSPYVFRF
jgi:hypothetical protein